MDEEICLFPSISVILLLFPAPDADQVMFVHPPSFLTKTLSLLAPPPPSSSYRTQVCSSYAYQPSYPPHTSISPIMTDSPGVDRSFYSLSGGGSAEKVQVGAPTSAAAAAAASSSTTSTSNDRKAEVEDPVFDLLLKSSTSAATILGPEGRRPVSPPAMAVTTTTITSTSSSSFITPLLPAQEPPVPSPALVPPQPGSSNSLKVEPQAAAAAASTSDHKMAAEDDCDENENLCISVLVRSSRSPLGTSGKGMGEQIAGMLTRYFMDSSHVGGFLVCCCWTECQAEPCVARAQRDQSGSAQTPQAPCTSQEEERGG